MFSGHSRVWEEKNAQAASQNKWNQGFLFSQCPDFQFMSERARIALLREDLRVPVSASVRPHSLVATDAGEHDAISLRG